MIKNSNGGFPPIKLCEKKKQTKEKKVEKGFFFSTKTNTINIKDILKKSSKKVISDVRIIDEDIDVISEL